VPAFTGEDVKVEIDRSDIDITIHGSLIGDIVNLFTWFFKGTVANDIEDSMRAALETTAPAIGSALVAASDGYAYIPFLGDLSNIILDWETPAPNVITATAIEMGTKGLIFERESGKKDFDTEIPELPWTDDDNNSGFQLFISDYTMDSATDAFFKATSLPFLIKSSYVPSSFPYQLTTSTLDYALPGIEMHYGADLPVDI